MITKDLRFKRDKSRRSSQEAFARSIGPVRDFSFYSESAKLIPLATDVTMLTTPKRSFARVQLNFLIEHTFPLTSTTLATVSVRKNGVEIDSISLNIQNIRTRTFSICTQTSQTLADGDTRWSVYITQAVAFGTLTARVIQATLISANY